MQEELEVERKYALGPDTAVRALLEGVCSGEVAQVGAPVAYDLRATYFDTADLRLAAARVTLRRRTGGEDAGWHLKLPGTGEGRRELRRPLGRAGRTVPRDVLNPVVGIVRGQPVVPVAMLHTRRTVYDLLGADGAVLAEVADDRVVGTALPTERDPEAYVSAWRELEVELRGGGPQLLAQATAALLGAGITPSADASKLARVLGRGAERAEGRGDPPGGRQTGQDLVLTALAARMKDLVRADVAVRLGDADGVHQFRVTCRRIRSILREYRSVLRRDVTDPLREGLAWIGAELSGARDAEVVLEHLLQMVGGEPGELVVGPVRERLLAERERAEVVAVRQVHRSLSAPRYLRLLDDLHDLVTDPPLARHAGRGAGRVAAAALTDCARRMQRRVQVAADAQGPARDLALHEVRKAAKTLRYTAEVAVSVRLPHGDGHPWADGVRRSEQVREAMKQVQEQLGDRQDTVVSRRECRRLGAAADAAGESSWTYGRLYTLEEGRASAAETAFWALWDTLEL